MNKRDRVKLIRPLQLVSKPDVIPPGTRGVVVDTGKNEAGEAMALVAFGELVVVVDCKRLMVTP